MGAPAPSPPHRRGRGGGPGGGGARGLALTTHTEVGAAGLLDGVAFLLHLAPVHAYVALVHSADGQLTMRALAIAPENVGPGGVALEDAPPRNIGSAVGSAAVVPALEIDRFPQAHCHRWRAPVHPQGLAPGACGEVKESGTAVGTRVCVCGGVEDTSGEENGVGEGHRVLGVRLLLGRE